MIMIKKITNMYVSGTLLEKTKDFLKKDIINFDLEGIDTKKLYFSYEGEILSPPWENDYISKLANRQENLIAKSSQEITLLTDLKFPLIKKEIQS